MADDIEVDIEGFEDDDEQTSSLELHSDPNVPPSSGANLLPEFSDPPWLLEHEPTWNIHDDIDDKSRDTIEKMLLEEELYFQGRSLPSIDHVNQQQTEKPKSSTSKSSSKSRGRKPLFSGGRNSRLPSHKMAWTNEEKTLFEQGMDIYGRSWTRIAQLIHTRTTLQVKNYANQYFKVKAREKKKTETDSSGSNDFTLNAAEIESEEAALEAVTTATTTVPTISRNATANSSISTITSTKRAARAKTETEKLQNVFENESLILAKTKNETFCSDVDDRECKQDSTSQENLSDVDEEDEDVDIDGDSDDNVKENLLTGRNLSPETIYSTLLKSAEILSESENSDLSSLGEKDEESYDCQNQDVNVCSTNIAPAEYNAHDGVESSTYSPGNNNRLCTTANSLGESSKCNKDFSPDDENDESRNTRLERPTTSGDDYEETCSTDDDSSDYYRVDESLVQFVKDEYYDDDDDDENKPDPWSGIPKATVEIIVDHSTTTRDEHIAHSEFFDGRPLKTPSRYMKIRNYILDAWEKCKPKYLTKTSVRPGLKNCGDVNCISRIHEYLEHVGAINFGVDNPYRSTRAAATTANKKTMTKEELLLYQKIRMQSMRPRKRKVRDAYGNWIDPDEFKGQRVEHQFEMRHNEESKSARSRPKYSKLSTYDPFKLVPCDSFTEDNKAPFSVHIESCALLIMDLHSHLSTTEVIGLLGGRYCHDSCHLQVVHAEPCNSISTGLQCEMDPVSQTKACESLRDMGFCVVGWYHSHPRFAPNPSVRDIETQAKYQEWFGQGGDPFVGVIVSPYDRVNKSPQSQVKCLTVLREMDTNQKHWLPYQFEFTVSNLQSNYPDELVNKIKNLIEEFSVYHHRVDMTRPFRSDIHISYLDKMISSLKAYASCDDHEDNILSVIQELIMHNYMQKSHAQDESEIKETISEN